MLNLEYVKVMKVLTQKNIKITFLVVFANKLISELIIVFRGENGAFKFIKAILKEYEYCKKVIKNTSTKI